MPLVPINIIAAKEHESKVERKIRQIKERACGIINTLPCKKLLHKMVIHLIYFITLWLHAVPINNGISWKFNPWELINRQQLSARRHCRLDFGELCEVYHQPEPSNSMIPGTHAVIALGSTGKNTGIMLLLLSNCG